MQIIEHLSLVEAPAAPVSYTHLDVYKRQAEVELYYNPEQMPAAEIKQTFVGREVMLKELLALARRQPQGAGVQHVLLIGARGMGKTTMMLMLRFAVLERDLQKKWQPVRFPEESYGIAEDVYKR